jgi:hypothetical protein
MPATPHPHGGLIMHRVVLCDRCEWATFSRGAPDILLPVELYPPAFIDGHHMSGSARTLSLQACFAGHQSHNVVEIYPSAEAHATSSHLLTSERKKKATAVNRFG